MTNEPECPLAPEVLARFKIPPRRVASDDCETIVGLEAADGIITNPGETYYLHKGEAVWVLPIGSIGAQMAFARLSQMGSGDVGDDVAGFLGRLDRGLEDICERLSRLVVAWNWTGIDGTPLPMPYRQPAVLRELESSELVWLQRAIQGQTASQLKNGSAPSPDGSTAMVTSRRKRG